MKTPNGTPSTRIVAVAIAVILSTAPLPAGSGGSVYSRFGVGDLRFTSATRLLGLGGTGAAYRPSGSINDVNPAAWSGISRMRFSAGALYEGFSTDDGTASAYLAGMFFNGLSLAIPVDSGMGIAFGAGIAPYSRVNYRIVEPVDQDGVAYTLTHIGDGGISRAFAGLSVRIAPGLSAAAQFNYFFGSNRYIMKQRFDGTAYTNAELTRTANVKGAGATFGVLCDELARIAGLPAGQTLAMGLSLTTTSWPTVGGERIFNYGAAVSTNPNDTLEGGERSFRLPFSLTGGLSYSSGNVLAAADVRYQDWGGNTYETYPGVRLKNGLRISAGAEITSGDAVNVSPGRRVSYTFGLYHDAGYLEIGGEAISENGVAAGITFPILNETRLSLAAGFAMRGSTDNLLQEDKIFRISASMDVTELWFQRPAEE
ncbi:MAG TPA: hypothetical protein VI932_00765 [Bacteroidota bacterium]|nr:hypothetical protein [Bacteroidota bacterium]